MSAADRDRPSFVVARDRPSGPDCLTSVKARGAALRVLAGGVSSDRATRRGFLASACAVVVTPTWAATHHALHSGHVLSRGGPHAATLHAPAVARGAAAPLPLVMLDPGHGGKDPGAIGVSGTYEKHIAEAAATELQRQLLATGR